MTTSTEVKPPKTQYAYLVLNVSDLTADAITYILNDHSEAGWRLFQVVGDLLYLGADPHRQVVEADNTTAATCTFCEQIIERESNHQCPILGRTIYCEA